MKERLLFLSKFYATLVAFFFVAKPLFMLYNGAVGRGCSVTDVAAVLWHGLPLDLATAGYLTALPLLATLVGTWVRLPWVRPVYLAYSAVVSLLLSLIFVGDACLYEFWDFKLDATIFNYIDSPRGVAASVSVGYLVAGFSVVLLVAAGLFLALRACGPFFMPRVRRRVAGTLFLLLAGGFLFLGIRGGTGRSTANVGMVYFSTDQFLNHSAVNPAFSLFYSMQKAEDFSSECNFFPEAKRAEIFSSLGYGLTGAPADTLLGHDAPHRPPGTRGRSLHALLCQLIPHRPRHRLHAERLSLVPYDERHEAAGQVAHAALHRPHASRCGICHGVSLWWRHQLHQHAELFPFHRLRAHAWRHRVYGRGAPHPWLGRYRPHHFRPPVRHAHPPHRPAPLACGLSHAGQP